MKRLEQESGQATPESESFLQNKELSQCNPQTQTRGTPAVVPML